MRNYVARAYTHTHVCALYAQASDNQAQGQQGQQEVLQVGSEQHSRCTCLQTTKEEADRGQKGACF